jgi:hypothetical protein
MRKFPTGNVENKTSKKYVSRETDLTHAHSRVIMSVIKTQNEYRHDNASGDASLADQNSRGEKDTSRDALLVPLQKQKGANVSGDASLADQNSRGEKDTSRDALLVPSEQRESNAASGDASLVPLQKQK